MGWVAGFVLGALGGFAFGCLAAPVAGVELRASARRRWKGDGEGREGSDRAAMGGAPRARHRPNGLLPDERLTRAARERWVARGLANPRVDVTTVDGVVYLRGRPREAAEATAIVEVVQDTPGVQGVVNELKPADGA